MYQYSFANVDLIMNVNYKGNKNKATFKIEGFAAGEGLIKIQRAANIATTVFGAYGDMVVNMHRNVSAGLSFNVLMNSPENKYLQDYANYFQAQANADGDLVSPIQATLIDNMGEDEVELTNGVILAMPAIIRGQTMNVVTWDFMFEKAIFHREIGKDFQEI